MTMVFSHKNAIFATKSNNKDREMISNVKKIWCLLVLLLWVQHSTGQTGRVFDADHQLSSSFTTQVFQDRDGFVWVLTRNGINIYDGYQFKIIKKEQAGNRLASNHVNCMAQDDTGLFYLGMDCALQTYDGYEFADVKVKDLAGYIVACYTNCLLRCRSGELLAGTSGHGVLRIADREHAEQLGGVLADVHTVYDMVEDKQGHVWMATSDAGLVEYDGKSLKRHFGAEGQVSSLRCLRVDKSGTLYVGTSNGGVYVRRWQQTGRTGGEWQSDFEQLKATAGRHVSALYVCDDGRLMVGFDGQGVGICDTTTGEMDDNPYYSYDVDLRMSKVYSILEDGSGNIWLGLLQKGIYMQNKQTTSFRYMGRRLGERNVIGHACVISTMIDSKGRCWVGTDKDGLYCLDEHQRMLRHFKAGCPTSVMSIAEDHEGVVNGAMLYDRHEMQALFQLSIGQPGSSFAIEIARKTGIPEEVIKDASDIVGQDYIQIDKYLQDIVRDKRYWEGKRQTIHQHEKKLEATGERLEAELTEIERQRKEILRKAKEEAEEMLRESNKRIENAIREIREQQAEKERTRKIREELDAFKEEVAEIDTRANDEAIARKIRQLQERKERREKRKAEKAEKAASASGRIGQGESNPASITRSASVPLKPGDTVRIKGLTSVGVIDSIDGSKAVVIFGGMKTKMRVDRLEYAEKPKTSATKAEERNQNIAGSYGVVSRDTRNVIDNRKLNFKQDIDVRGMRGDEAINAITYFIDDAILVGVSRVRILHGTGSGILRQLIRQYLATIPNVTHYRDEHVQFGGSGITVVDLE